MPADHRDGLDRHVTERQKLAMEVLDCAREGMAKIGSTVDSLQTQSIDDMKPAHPQIVKEAARGLSGANVNILNGADGLGEIAAGLVGQGIAILDAVRKGIDTSTPTVEALDEKSESAASRKAR